MASNVILFRKTEQAKANVQDMADQAIDFLNRHEPKVEDNFMTRRVRELEEQAQRALEQIFLLTPTRYAAYSKGRELVKEALERVYKA
jgi:hypothetical protein